MNSGSAPATNRFERRKERTRQDLVAAATTVLAQKGLRDTKIADIAAAADVGVGTFYLHFPTKEALFEALVDDTIGRFKAAVDAAREAVTDPVERLLAANRAFCDFAQANREVFKIVFGPGSSHHVAVQRAQALFASDIEENIRDGIASGVFGTVPPVLASQALVGMATQLLAWWTADEAVPMDWLYDTISTLALRGLSPLPTPPGGSSHA